MRSLWAAVPGEFKTQVDSITFLPAHKRLLFSAVVDYKTELPSLAYCPSRDDSLMRIFRKATLQPLP